MDIKEKNLELKPEAMLKMGEAALKSIVEHIKDLPDAPRSNLNEKELYG